ncbi:hypothetical protein BGC_20370 [Burkholderia sp. 3C]
MQQHLARIAQAVDQRLDRAAMVAVGRVDHGVGRLRLANQQRAIVERTDARLDADRAQFLGLRLAPHQPDHLMPVGGEACRDRPADETARTRDEHLHVVLLSNDSWNDSECGRNRSPQKPC